MSSASKKQRVSLVSTAAGPLPARPPALSDAVLRAALRPGQFVVMGSESADNPGHAEYTLYRFVSVSPSGAEVLEYDPDASQSASSSSAQPPAAAVIRCDWSERLCLPVRPTLVSGSVVFALYYSAESLLPTTVYYQAEVMPAVKSKSKAKDRQVKFAGPDGAVQTTPYTVEWEGVQLPVMMTVSPTLPCYALQLLAVACCPVAYSDPLCPVVVCLRCSLCGSPSR